MPTSEIVYLGPEGTYAHRVARKKYGRNNNLKFKGLESVYCVCEYVAAKPSRKGVIPIENSSSGAIYETVDALLDENLSLKIEEEVAINVKLALLGRKGDDIRTIYSHSAPRKHCGRWIESRYPRAKWIETNSTAAAAKKAFSNEHSAAIGSRLAASLYKLDIIQYPIPGVSELNVTHFFIVSKRCATLPRAGKTSLAVRLCNRPGALYDFLKPLAEAGINLSRIISRPIEGKPGVFGFFIDVDKGSGKALRDALRDAQKSTVDMKILGSYPSYRIYQS